MIITVKNEAPFQILSGAFTIGPSPTGYDLQVGATPQSFTTLFSVGANTPRMVTNVANGSYYRLKNNVGDVQVNWSRTCVDGGGGSGSGSTYTAGEYISIDQDVISVTGITPDLYLTTADTQDFATQADITAATSPIEEHLNDVEYVTATALTELHDAILEISGSTGGSNYIIPAITSQAEYEAISGDVKSGDLIEVEGVDINGDGNPVSGLFAADVQEEEYEGVVRKSIYWRRRDSLDSVLWSSEDYTWMIDNDVNPIEIARNGFIIAFDELAGDETYNGIGFDGDGKPVITHFVPAYDDETGEITGITREDANIIKSTSVSSIWRGTQAEYDAIATPDASTLYIIINN